MAEDWSAVAAEVAEGLAEAGTSATIIRAGEETGPAHDPTPGQPTSHPCTVVYDTWRNDQIDGTLIRQSDLKIMCSASGLSITPAPNDRFKGVDGKECSIMNVEPLQPAGVPVMYVLQVRG
jgi:hypothetical protein